MRIEPFLIQNKSWKFLSFLNFIFANLNSLTKNTILIALIEKHFLLAIKVFPFSMSNSIFVLTMKIWPIKLSILPSSIFRVLFPLPLIPRSNLKIFLRSSPFLQTMNPIPSIKIPIYVVLCANSMGNSIMLLPVIGVLCRYWHFFLYFRCFFLRYLLFHFSRHRLLFIALPILFRPTRSTNGWLLTIISTAKQSPNTHK